MIYGNEDWLDGHFEWDEDIKGWVGYKVFNSLFEAPEDWKIESGSWIEEMVDTNLNKNCAFGINIAPNIDWLDKYLYENRVDLIGGCFYKVWRVWIFDDEYTKIVIPFDTDGKIRVSRCLLSDVRTELDVGSDDDE